MGAASLLSAAIVVAVCGAAIGAAASHGQATSVLEDLGLALPSDFFAKTFERKSLVLRGSSTSRALFRSIWGWRQVRRLAFREGFRSYQFGIPQPAFDPEPGEDGAVKAGEALRHNLTLVQNHVHRTYAPLARYMRRATAFFALPGGMNSYTTPPGCVGFAYHFDPSDAFILQVQGSKLWDLCMRKLPDPLKFANLTYNQFYPDHPDVQDCESVELHEGDAIYLPIGLVHRAASSNGLSVHLTMSLNRQFASSASMLLNLAEQINPSRETGFAQKPFVAWVHNTAADPSGALVALHDVPRGLLCHKRARRRGSSEEEPAKVRRRRCRASDGFFDPRLLGDGTDVDPDTYERTLPEEMVHLFLDDMRQSLDLLAAHPSASSEQLKLGVRLDNKPETVVGFMRPLQVLTGLRPLLGLDACRRAVLSWRSFVTRQLDEHAEDVYSALGDEEEEDSPATEIDDEEAIPFMDSEGAAPFGLGSGLVSLAAASAAAVAVPPAPTQAAAVPPAPREAAVARESGAHADEPEVAACDFRDEELDNEAAEPANFDWGYPEEPSAWGYPAAALESATAAVADAGAGRAQRGAFMSDDAADIPESPRASPQTMPAKTRSSSFVECCEGASAKAQVLCANETSPPVRRKQRPGYAAEDEHRVLIVTYATPHVYSFARYSLAVNANWAKRFGHAFVVDARDRATGGVDVKNSKVLVKRDWASREDISERWLLWIGADAILVDFDDSRDDVLRRLIIKHGSDPNVQVIITRDPHGRAGNSLSLFNADVILLRRSKWSTSFLQRWWDDPRMKEGRTDQEVLELLYLEDILGANSKFVLLPPLTLNSDSLSIVAGPPRQQPVIHLGGHADTIRTSLFRGVLLALCERGETLDPRSLELQDWYIDALADEVRTPSEGLSSGHAHASALTGTFHRLAWHLEERGRFEEAVGIQRKALRFVRKRFGPDSRDTMQAASALASSLRGMGRVDEAEGLYRWAFKRMSDTLGPDNRDTLTGANNLGLVLEARGQHAEAESLYRAAHVGLGRTLGAEAPATLSATFNLATVLGSRVMRGAGGRDADSMVAEAERLHRQVLDGRERALGSRSPAVVESQDALASLLVAFGGAPRAMEAEVLQRAALRARAPNAGDGSRADAGMADRGAVQAQSTLAQSLRLQGRMREAVELFKVAYELCRDTPELGGHDGPNTFAAASNLASAMQDAGRIMEASVLFKSAVAGLRRTLGEEHPNTRGVVANYEKFLQETGAGSSSAVTGRSP